MKKLFEALIFWGIRVITFDYHVVKKLIREHKGKPKKVLDLGSGNGYLATLFPAKSYLGIEINVALIESARKNFPSHIFKVGDITKLNLRPSFDLILVVGVLHHLDTGDFDKSLKETKKLLSKNGKILVIEAAPPINKYNLFGKALRSLDRGSHIRTLKSYQAQIGKYFEIKEAKNVNGGIVDYAFFILGQKQL